MRKIKKSFFTLLEVLVSMGVFSLLMLALMQFFSAAQGVWERTGNKAELFESAKTAMDIIANDLACAYYEMDHGPDYQFFSISSGDSSQVVFAAQKEDGNAQLYYKWVDVSDTTTKHFWKLHRVEKKESDVFTSGTPSGNWFTRSGKTGWITDMSGTVLYAGTQDKDTPYCLAENVLDFSIRAYKKSDLTSPISVSASADDKFPDVIIISMTMLSNDAHEKLRNRFSDKTTDAAKDAEIQTLFNTTTFQYIKSDGSDSSESEKKTVRQMLIDGTPPAGGDDTNQAILFNGCQRFTRAVSLVDRVTFLK